MNIKKVQFQVILTNGNFLIVDSYKKVADNIAVLIGETYMFVPNKLIRVITNVDSHVEEGAGV